MNSANDKYSKTSKLTFEEFYRRINCSISRVCCSFSSSVQVNRQTLTSLESTYTNLLSKLEETHKYLKDQLNLTATKNAQLKDFYEKKLKDFKIQLESLENMYDDTKNIPSDQYNSLVTTLQELRQDVYFQRLGLKIPKTETIYFDLFELSKTSEKPVWIFIDPSDGIERFFTFAVEKQLENGYIRNSCNFKLTLEDGQCFGYADFNSMQLLCTNPKMTLKLIRKHSEATIIHF